MVAVLRKVCIVRTAASGKIITVLKLVDEVETKFQILLYLRMMFPHRHASGF